MPSQFRGHRIQHDRQSTYEDMSGGIRVCLPDSSSLACSSMVPSIAEDVSEEPSLASHGTGSPVRPPHPLVLEGCMFLTAWTVSGKPIPPSDFLTESQNCYYSHGEQKPTQHITQPGLSGVASVLKASISFFSNFK